MILSDALDYLATLFSRPITDGSDVLFWVVIVFGAYCALVFLLLPSAPRRPASKAVATQENSKIIVLGQHEHSYSQPFTFERVPVSGGRHTDYLIMVCPGCLTAVAFPRDNFLLATPEHQQWVKDGLRDIGITLLTD